VAWEGEEILVVGVVQEMSGRVPLKVWLLNGCALCQQTPLVELEDELGRVVQTGALKHRGRFSIPCGHPLVVEMRKQTL
jgi:hypothetical protein